MEQEQDDKLKGMQEALARGQSEGVPKFYFNSYTYQPGYTDFTIVLQQNGTPVATLFASHSCVKSLALALSEVVTKMEKNVKLKFPTFDQIEKALRAAQQQQPPKTK